MLSHFLRKWWPFGRADAASTVARAADGLRWHVLPAAAPYFDVPALAEWVRSGLATVVKKNLQRTVYRVPLPAGAVFVKVCRANTPRAWAREILRPPKARLEFENALRLQALGIGCTAPLAWGERDSRWPGESVIVTREQADADPLDEYLSRLPAATRRPLAVALGRFVAKLHDEGVRHPDPHPGNFLVEVPPSGVPRFYLLDVHSVRFGPPLTWDERRVNLVLLNRWFQMRASRTDRARFWRAYSDLASRVSHDTGSGSPAFLASRVSHDTGSGSPAPLQGRLAKKVEAATFASNLRFWATRTGRYLGNNRQFRKVERGALRGHAVKDLLDEVREALFADPDAVFELPGVVILKDSASATVILWNPSPLGERGRGEGDSSKSNPDSPSPPTPLPQGRGGPARFLLKRFHLKKRFAALRNLFRRSPALRSWVNGHALLDRGIPTARPLLALHRYRRGLPGVGYVLLEVVEGAVELPDAVARFDRRLLADRLGRLLRRIHDRQVSHADLKAPNILVTPAGEPVLIDLVGVTTGRPVPESQRMRELTRLAASFADSPLVSRTDRLRLLRAYLQANGANWKSWWGRIADGVRVKVRRNASLGRPLG